MTDTVVAPVGDRARVGRRGPTRVGAAGAGAGAMTMVSLCFANGLQGGGSQTFAQSIDSLKHTFHVTDFAIGVIPFLVGIAGNAGAVPIAQLCTRRKRTMVLAGMFAGWGVLMALAGAVPAVRLAGFAAAGFVLFGIFRVGASFLEATDPAAIPLIADWWPVRVRARQVSIFNAGAGIAAFAGIIGSGLIVDNLGWRWAFAAWLPIAFLGTWLISRRPEPERGGQDAAYADGLEEATTGAEHDLVVDLVEHESVAVGTAVEDEVAGGKWDVVRAVFRLRSWRLVAIGLAVTGIMGDGLGAWGLTYFKRTFHLSSVKAGALAPALGAGAFVGVLVGGFLADWLLARGVLRARVLVTGLGFGTAGIVYVASFTSSRLAVAAPLLAVASALATMPTGPQFAAMMDVTPSPLRSQATAAGNVLEACGALGALVVGGLSTLIGNLRLALLCVSPFYLIGGALVLAACGSYVADVATVVAEARSRTGSIT